jgi:hypothetical protein
LGLAALCALPVSASAEGFRRSGLTRADLPVTQTVTRARVTATPRRTTTRTTLVTTRATPRTTRTITRTTRTTRARVLATRETPLDLVPINVAGSRNFTQPRFWAEIQANVR